MAIYGELEQRVLVYLEAKLHERRGAATQAKRGVEKIEIMRDCSLSEIDYSRTIGRLEADGIVATVARNANGEFVNIHDSIIELVQSLTIQRTSGPRIQQMHVVNLFIAGPGDVESERREAEQAVSEWNAANQNRGVMVRAVLESHAQASATGHPQETINAQLLAGCSLLIAIFGSRLGTPTNSAPSGTVQEIEEFISNNSGRYAMLFFSIKSHPSDVDLANLEALRKFQSQMQPKCLYKEFNEDFGSLVRHQLAVAMNNFISDHRLMPQESTVRLNPRQAVLRELKCIATEWDRKWPDYETKNDEELARRYLRTISRQIPDVFKKHPDSIPKRLQDVIEETCPKLDQDATTTSPQSWDVRHFWTKSKRLYDEFTDGIEQVETL